VPDNVPSIDLVVSDDVTRLTWGSARRATHYIIRHSPLLEDAQWSTSTEVASRVTGTMTVVPSMTGTFMVKAYNAVSEYESRDAIGIVSTVGGLRGLNVVSLVEEHPDWDGVRHNVEVTEDGELTLSVVVGVLDWPEILS